MGMGVSQRNDCRDAFSEHHMNCSCLLDPKHPKDNLHFAPCTDEFLDFVLLHCPIIASKRYSSSELCRARRPEIIGRYLF